MTREGKSPDEIIQKILDSHTIYGMDAQDVIRLHEHGVDDRAIDCMLNTKRIFYERHVHHYHRCDPSCPCHEAHVYWQ